MDMTKYYWEAKDANEVNLIARMANVEIDPGFEPVYGKWAIKNGKLSWLYLYSKPAQTLSTLEDLFEMAMRGFKEPWEVPPEGYRLVTDAEREHEAPEGTKIFHKDFVERGWHRKTGKSFDPPGVYNRVEYAVPADYEFRKPVEITTDDITTDDIMRVCGDALRNEFGDNFKITK